MRKSEIASFFKIYNQIQEVVHQLDMRSPYQYNVRIKEIKESKDNQIIIRLDIFNDYDAEDGFFFNIVIPQKYLDNKHQNDIQNLADDWVKLIHKNILKIKNL